MRLTLPILTIVRVFYVVQQAVFREMTKACVYFDSLCLALQAERGIVRR